MTRGELPPHAATIKHAIGSAATCNKTTVEALTTILRLKRPPQNGSEEQRNEPSQATTQARSARSTSKPRATARAKGAINIAKDQPAEDEILRPHERYILATEVINTSLAALTETIRAPPSPICHSSAKAQKTSNSNCNPAPKAGKESQRPLGQRCVNRISQSPEKKSHSGHSPPIGSANQVSGVCFQAQCAVQAFAALRVIQRQKLSSNDIPYLQLETGMSALVGKLLALGFEDLAVKELAMLRERLSIEYQGASAGHATQLKDTESCTKVETPTSSKVVIADLLHFDHRPTDDQTLALIVTSQLQVLKLLGLKKRPSVIEAAWKHLRSSASYSPANMIQRLAASALPDAERRSARYLQTLSVSLLSLCPSVSSSEDDAAVDSIRSVSPQTSLQYQILALEMRSRWWQLSGHQGDFQNDILDPFARCLNSFLRRCKLAPSEKYNIARDAFLSFSAYVELGRVLDSSNALSREPVILTIYSSLQGLAMDARLHEEAIHWDKEIMAGIRHVSVTASRRSAIICQSAIIQLQIRAVNPKVDANHAILGEAVDAMEGDLQGDSAELDELSITVASLRKQAFSTLQCDSKRISPLTDLCSKLMLTCLSFLIRYLGKEPGVKASDKVASRYRQRKEMAQKLAKPTIESIIVMARHPALGSVDAWDRVDYGLQNCLQLASGLENDSPGATFLPNENEAAHLPFIHLSNAYWCRFLSLRQCSAESRDQRSVLRKSIDILRNRSNLEKVAGFLPIKLERLAEAYALSNELTKAMNYYAEALRTQANAGLLRSFFDGASLESTEQLLVRGGELSVFTRILQSYMRVFLKADVNDFTIEKVYENCNLLPSELGLVLEQQLAALTVFLRDRGPSSKLFRTLRNVVNSLLTVYDATTHPLRRLRVVVCIMQIQSSNPVVFDSNLIDRLSQEEKGSLPESLGLDVGLEPFVAHLQNSHNVLAIFTQGASDIDGIESALKSWKTITQECSTWQSLQSRVDNTSDWVLLLELIAEYLEMQGSDLSRVTVLYLLNNFSELQESTERRALIYRLSCLGLQYMRLGYVTKAGLALQKAQRHVEASEKDDIAALRWNIAYAEYLCGVGNVSKCEEHFEKACEIFRGDLGSKDLDDNHYLEGCVKAELAYLRSQISIQKSQIQEGLIFTRLAVRLLYSAWAMLERQAQRPIKHEAEAPGGELSAVTNELSELSISTSKTLPIQSTKYKNLKGASFWPVVPRLFRGLVQLSGLFAHVGIYQEAQYYAEQAGKIANAVKASLLQGHCLCLVGRYQARSGSLDESSATLQQARSVLSEVPKHRYSVQFQIHIAETYALQHRWEDKEAVLKQAEEELESLMKTTFLERFDFNTAPDQALNPDMRTLTLTTTEKLKPRQARQSQLGKRNISRLAEKPITSQPTSRTLQFSDCSPLFQLRSKIMRLWASSAIHNKRIDKAALYLSEAANYFPFQEERVLQALWNTRLLLSQSFEHMIRDPVFCVLPESTVCNPSTTYIGSQQTCQSSGQPDEAVKPIASNRKVTTQKPVGPAARKEAVQRSSFRDFLDQARDEITSIQRSAQKVSSSAVNHAISDILSKALMITSAACSFNARNSMNAKLAAYALELGKIVSTVKESSTVRAEQLLCSQSQVISGDFMKEFHEGETLASDEGVDFSQFQARYVDIIPTSWNVVSLSLSDSGDELRVSKIRAHQTPFILTLPLSRHNSRDSEEAIFGFEEGKAELKEIIDLANYSTHDTQDLSRKGAKKKWWEARAALDDRLKDLLINIENIWFGGFRGIFAQNLPSPKLLSRFQASFYNILDKHLPSRQKSGKGPQNGGIRLDPRVLELFVGLGSPGEVEDLDEPLTDLLYFVVDILQFHGECNAYDEIDFDSIIMDTIDALHQYHEATLKESHKSNHDHTILILDKSLHVFPWESMPCMIRNAISRLPSLEYLRQRIVQQEEQRSLSQSPLPDDHGFEGIIVSPQSGAYVLNPACDLKSTQTVFSEPLEALSNWDGIVQREPEEAEMRASLADKDIFLYFGHGSGGQYIRSRTIKKLDRCAVALLMGCSSGVLTQAGDFEPYGTPISYMQAGSPALLATLWDVTDKDIDRFSQIALEKWGLFKAFDPRDGTSPMKRSVKSKGKSNKTDVATERKLPLSLDEAVVQARGSCILRYLNGAAPVVYGVPVFLS